MFSQDLILLHRAGPSKFSFADDPSVARDWFCFKTCMRHIVIGDIENLPLVLSQLKPDDEIYRGDDAYRFVLQVVCGLRSPLIGETEVSGQFKNAVSSFQLPATPFGLQLQKFFRALFEDAKTVRQAHLVDLGSQSYGSVLRRELKGLSRIHLLGAGHLVQEILPWLCKDGNEVHVHCRDPKKAALELGAFSQLRIHALDERRELASAEGLVIAAPVTAEWIKEWMMADGCPQVVADLRGDSTEDRISGFHHVLSLPQLLERISSNQAHLLARKQAALQAIDEAVIERSRHVEYRPFGWEDVCA